MREPVKEPPKSESAEADASPFAIIDVGSNSIRLVVYRSLSRAPVQLYNEKCLCGLARGLNKTGRLNKEGIECALATLERFCRLARGFGSSAVDIVATAAVRSASNGPDFVNRAKKLTKHPIVVLSGDDEARYTATGVALSFHNAVGAVGDLGGGSLELATIDKKGVAGTLLSLDIGSFTFAELLESDSDKAKTVIDEAFASAQSLAGAAKGKDFYLVGGAWRALARIRLAMTRAPLRVVHGTVLDRAQVDVLTSTLSDMSVGEVAHLPGVPARRAPMVPAAASILHHAVSLLDPQRVIFSAFGLREGRLFSGLSSEARSRDPLVEGANDIGRHESRMPEIGKALYGWTKKLVNDDETPALKRMRRAACALSDIGWQYHPETRAREVFFHVAQLPLAGIFHDERAFLAYTLFVRYEGDRTDMSTHDIVGLLSQEQAKRAEQLGLALSLGYRLCGGVPEVVNRSRLKVKSDRINLYIDPADAPASSDSLRRRLKKLAVSMDRKKAKVKATKS